MLTTAMTKKRPQTNFPPSQTTQHNLSQTADTYWQFFGIIVTINKYNASYASIFLLNTL